MGEFDFDVLLPYFKDKIYHITDFDTENNINSAISKCHENGGGTVVIPRGIWHSKPILLKSNVRLHLEDGAVVLFSGDYDDYPLVYTSWEGFFTYRCMPQIYAKNEENIAITGNGIFNGNGFFWRPVKKFKVTEDAWNSLVKSGGIVDDTVEETIWWPSESALEANKHLIPNPGDLRNKEICKTYRDYLRPVLLNFTECKKILLDGPTFTNSPSWSIHPWQCEHLTVKNIKIKSHHFSQNGDGIDIDSCKYVHLSNSIFDVGDDAICLKSGKNKDGRELNKPSEFIIIDNCVVYQGHGGFVIGSEMSGGIRNIKISNLTFIGTDTGLRFKSCLGRGGVVEDIYIDSIDMIDIEKEAIIFTMGYNMDTKEGQPVSKEEIPEFKNIYIKNVVCDMAESSIHISGLDVLPVSNIHFENVNITAKNDIYMEFAEQIELKNTVINLI